MNSLQVLLPDFAIIAVGALVGNKISEDGWRHIDWLCYYLLYPALLFNAASQRPIELDSLLLIGVLAALLVSAGFLLALSVGSLSGEGGSANKAGISQNAWRFNTALGFVAITALPTGASAILAIVVGVAIPLANLYAVFGLTRGQSHSRMGQLGEIALNPFLLASLLGVVVGLTGQAVPAGASAFIGRLADAAIPVVLLSLGAALRQSRIWPPDSYSLAISAIKLLVLPALVCLVVLITGARGIVPATLLIFAALPTASAAHVLAARYGADRSRVAIVVMQSTALGLLTLPVWTALAAHLAQ